MQPYEPERPGAVLYLEEFEKWKCYKIYKITSKDEYEIRNQVREIDEILKRNDIPMLKLVFNGTDYLIGYVTRYRRMMPIEDFRRELKFDFYYPYKTLFGRTVEEMSDLIYKRVSDLR